MLDTLSKHPREIAYREASPTMASMLDAGPTLANRYATFEWPTPDTVLLQIVARSLSRLGANVPRRG